MEISHSLEMLRKQLARHRLPAAYVERVLGELGDHQEDILAAQSSRAAGPVETRRLAAEQLGDPARLADHFVSEFRRRTFAGRHPFATFLVAPIPLILFAWVAIFAVVILTDKVLDALGFSGLAGYDAQGHLLAVAKCEWLLIHWGMMFVPPVVVALFFCRLARRTAQDWRWLCASCMLIAVGAFSFKSTLELGTGPGTARYSFGFGFAPGPMQFVQMAVPLLLGGFWFWRHREASKVELA